jgi:hypothetical protein
MKSIDAELKAISAAHDGVLLPEHVVAYAKNEKTALHNQFEWDDTKAGEQWRLQQARQLIRVRVEMVQLKETEDPVRVRSFWSLPSDRYGNGGGYRDTPTILSRQQTRNELLAMATQEMETFQRKYSLLKELTVVFEAMREVRKRLSGYAFMEEVAVK